MELNEDSIEGLNPEEVMQEETNRQLLIISNKLKYISSIWVNYLEYISALIYVMYGN